MRRADRPSHDDVIAAVSDLDDDELASWVSEPGGYVLVPVAFDRAEHHDFFALTPVDASHPIGVLLARDQAGVLVVVSGRPSAARDLLRAEPGLVDAETIVALLAPTWDDVEYLGPGSEPPVEAVEGGWRCDLRVRDGFGAEPVRWRVQLTDDPQWEVEQR